MSKKNGDINKLLEVLENFTNELKYFEENYNNQNLDISSKLIIHDD